jgi:hypothetical protein
MRFKLKDEFGLDVWVDFDWLISFEASRLIEEINP